MFPFNRNVFREDEFAPSSVTDQPDPNTNCEVFASSISKAADRQDEEIQIDNTSETNNGNNNENTTCDWDIIDLYVHTLNRKVIHVPGDGHCILHSIRRALKEENIDDISHDKICFKLRHEIIINKGYYLDFAGDRDIVADIENYITKMEFNNDTIDIVITALCNSFGISAILYQVVQKEVQIFAHAPGREGVLFRGDIHIAKAGVNGNAHYNCIGLLTHQENTDHNMNIETQETTCTDIPQFSPEHIRPHPKAPPREGKARNRKRKTAILTDTPEKDAIEDALRRREQRKNKPSKRSKVSKVTPRSKPLKKKPAQRKKHVEESDSSENEDWYCLICVEPYSNSKSREKWIQCIACKDWAHEECTAVSRGKMFVCQNCDSDYSDEN